MHYKTRKMILILFLIISLIALTGCQKSIDFDEKADFNTMVEEAEGTLVTFYGWGGDDQQNKWIDTVVTPTVKEKYDITLKRVPIDIDQVLSKLSGEKQANKTKGSIDIIWINGENFYSAKENGFLHGPFTHKLPNYEKYMNPNDEEVTKDFGFPIEGYEAPFSKAQLVLIKDAATTPETPKNTAELLAYAKKYKGKVTYPAPPDFTGSAFVRNIIYDIVGFEELNTIKADKAKIKQTIMPAIEYMRELNQYLWNEGKTFPATVAQLDNMFADGEVVMNISYAPYSVANFIANGTYRETVQAFQFDKGTIGNTNYLAIAQNAPNKQGALVVINEILSAEMQASKLRHLKALPVVDYNKLSLAEKQLFDEVEMGEGCISQDELLSKRIPEIPANLVPIIEEIWQEEVVKK
ncbi:MAG TPA: ABC transporter substrate-binding protein [Syntrophomonadaceae bacterium]|nr:ABC transporter substrate-binding protein [Syntrophomonadaceae bacterium]